MDNKNGWEKQKDRFTEIKNIKMKIFSVNFIMSNSLLIMKPKLKLQLGNSPMFLLKNMLYSSLSQLLSYKMI